VCCPGQLFPAGDRSASAKPDVRGERRRYQPGSTLEIEFASQARNNPDLRRAFAQRAAAIRTAIAALIAAGARERGVELTLPPEQLATTVLSVGLGLALQRAFDPSVSARALTDTIRIIVGLPLQSRAQLRTGSAGQARS
jgi:hypothetical protein